MKNKTRNPKIVIDDLRRDRFNLGEVRSRLPYHFTAKEDKAFSMVQEALYKTRDNDYQKANKILDDFLDYLNTHKLHTIYTQAQAGTGEVLKEGSKNQRLGVIERYFQETKEIIYEKINQ